MKLYSNEIVFRGHPDKVCDQISDAILDECLKQDPNSRCGIETVGGKKKIFITGEITSKTTSKFTLIHIEKYYITFFVKISFILHLILPSFLPSLSIVILYFICW